MARRTSFLIETISQAILDARAKATRFRDQRLRVAGEMAEDCTALAEVFDGVADHIQERLAEAQGRNR